MTDHGGFSCAVTGFEGLQEEILRLRNANRERPETLDYLSWRYRSVADAPEPRVFWLLQPTGERVGMASAIFRPYRINNQRVLTAVIGDISLDARWRGRGLGQMLLRFMTQHLDEHFPRQPAFVIPTEAARRALTNVGWLTPGSLIPYVCVLDATRYLRTTLRSPRLAAAIARPLQDVVRALTRPRVPRDRALFLSNARDDSAFELVGALPPQECAMRDLGPDELNWRYAQHPHSNFVFGRFYRAGALCGLVVFEDDVLAQACTIYDLAARNAGDLGALLALLVRRSLAAELTSLRMAVDNRHPTRSLLRGLGFVARRVDSVFQVHSSNGVAEKIAWRVTQGDKDT